MSTLNPNAEATSIVSCRRVHSELRPSPRRASTLQVNIPNSRSRSRRRNGTSVPTDGSGITAYQAKYFASLLGHRIASGDVESLFRVMSGCSIDLNLHQIDAALFACKSPGSVLLADETGLGKMIEAALVIGQTRAQGNKHVICIVPSNLRHQWAQELAAKFNIDSVILDGPVFKQMADSKVVNPFDQPGKVVICSYHFAHNRNRELRQVAWDLVVADEAHHLRNVYRSENVIANSILQALHGRRKILLTATPLQNSLMELYGLATFIDPYIFGSHQSFRRQYADNPNLEELQQRLGGTLWRTLRRDLMGHVKFTRRQLLTVDFKLTRAEQKLYDGVSAYLRHRALHALPEGRRPLLTLMLRKILASSSFAIALTLGKFISRLECLQSAEATNAVPPQQTREVLALVDDLIDDFAEEGMEQAFDSSPCGCGCGHGCPGDGEPAMTIQQELALLRSLKALAESIEVNAKGAALLGHLNTAFEQAVETGAPQKAIVFTESRRTQSYLKQLLDQNGYGGQVVAFNGDNQDSDSQSIYQRWRLTGDRGDRVTRSAKLELRTALIDHFRDNAKVMIATEALGEGMNLQFCSTVINYDLPWNPQRVEQRIGRCHRYGQLHDVTVVNLLNTGNAADQRVHELLAEKLHLFDGMFGASDEVLGALEHGKDFERRVASIYQASRTAEQIELAFDELRAEMEESIRERKSDARSKLFNHFAEGVRDRVRDDTDNQMKLDRVGRWLWLLTEHELQNHARFDQNALRFDLPQLPPDLSAIGVQAGTYRLSPELIQGEQQYRLGHPLAAALVRRAAIRSLPTAELAFSPIYCSLSNAATGLQGMQGWLQLDLLKLKRLENFERLVWTGIVEGSDDIPSQEMWDALLLLPAQIVENKLAAESEVNEELECSADEIHQQLVKKQTDEAREWFDKEVNKLDRWERDLKSDLDLKLAEMDQEIAKARKELFTPDPKQRVAAQKRIGALDRKRNLFRRDLFREQDKIADEKQQRLTAANKRLSVEVTRETLFRIRWSLE